MSRKLLLILGICLAALSCVYAGTSGDTIDVSVTPSSYQVIKVGNDKYESTSGLAASVGYMKTFSNGLSVGGDLEWSNYKLEKLQDYNAYNNIALLARCTYKFTLSEKVAAEAGLGLGYELCIVDKNTSNSFVAELCGQFDITVDDVFTVLAGVKAKSAFQKTTHVYSFLPFVGAGIAL